jgi:hypothetical protein
MIKKHLDGEIPMLLNFYSLKRKKPIEKFIFISSDNQFNTLLSQFIRDTYKLEPLPITLPGYLRWVTLDWFSVIGSALRGLIPRYSDTIVSLSPVGTEESYSQNHLYRVASLWAKISLTIILLLTSVFGLLDTMFFRSIAHRYSQALLAPLDQTIVEKDRTLRQNADEFNALVKILTQARTYQQNDQQILSDIFTSATQKNITIRRILMSNTPANNITILGGAATKANVLGWKQSLEVSNVLKDISMPLESLLETPEGVTFTLNAKI